MEIYHLPYENTLQNTIINYCIYIVPKVNERSNIIIENTCVDCLLKREVTPTSIFIYYFMWPYLEIDILIYF